MRFGQASGRAGGRRALRSVHLLCAGFATAYFALGSVTDLAYLRTAEMQWSNFSAWLIVAGLTFTGAALAASLASLVFGLRGGLSVTRVVATAGLGLAFILGLVNAFKHSQDGWSSVGALGLGLSVLSSVAALGAALALALALATRAASGEVGR